MKKCDYLQISSCIYNLISRIDSQQMKKCLRIPLRKKIEFSFLTSLIFFFFFLEEEASILPTNLIKKIKSVYIEAKFLAS
jgi:hypothetical protein